MRLKRSAPLIAVLSALSVSSAALVVPASSAAGQVRTANPDKRGLQLSEFPRVVKLAENVYGYEEIRNPGFASHLQVIDVGAGQEIRIRHRFE